jgi:hypothetical protein
MSDFEQLPSESPRSWLDRLGLVDTACLPREEQRLHLHCLADARRLLQEEQQKARWDRKK